MKYELDLDWTLLAQQKRALLQVFFNNKGLTRVHLEGVINLIDNIQDQAFEQGAPVVWLTENKEKGEIDV